MPPTDKAPSRYHQRVYTGKYEWGWDSSHPDLEPTRMIIIDGEHLCAYCGGAMYPIQAGLRREHFLMMNLPSRCYAVTGYCCICEGAEKEKAIRAQQQKVNDECDRKVNAIEAERRAALAKLKLPMPNLAKLGEVAQLQLEKQAARWKKLEYTDKEVEINIKVVTGDEF